MEYFGFQTQQTGYIDMNVYRNPSTSATTCEDYRRGGWLRQINLLDCKKRKDFPTHTQPTRLYPDDRISRLNAKMRAEFYLRTRKQQHPVKIQKHIHQNHEHPLEIRKET